MSFWDARRMLVLGSRFALPLLAGVLCAGAQPSGAVGAPHSRAAQPAATVPAPVNTADPCAPSSPATETQAATSSRSRMSTMVSLMAQAKGQEGAPAGEAQRGGPGMEKLWSSRIAAPAAGEDAETSKALQQLIRQVHSLTTNEKRPTAPAPVAEPVKAAALPQPAPVADEVTKSVETPAPTAAAPQAVAELTAESRKNLEDLRKNPSRVQDPLEAADLLFLSGRPIEAAPFYAEALRRTPATDTTRAGDRAWMLFQLGNCLRETDTAKAQESYLKLVAEYPDSPWTEMARAGGRFLTWYQSTRPDQLAVVRKP